MFLYGLWRRDLWDFLEGGKTMYQENEGVTEPIFPLPEGVAWSFHSLSQGSDRVPCGEDRSRSIHCFHKPVML